MHISFMYNLFLKINVPLLQHFKNYFLNNFISSMRFLCMHIIYFNHFYFLSSLSFLQDSAPSVPNSCCLYFCIIQGVQSVLPIHTWLQSLPLENSQLTSGHTFKNCTLLILEVINFQQLFSQGLKLRGPPLHTLILLGWILCRSCKIVYAHGYTDIQLIDNK